ncbi:hypothetical protein H4J38_14335 [Colwellia sp. BRX10-3]|uniref:COG3014 family protein n=1 Tax=Colwellia sp. BRX10-3 TaxID=2759844 RepID=UPI0015F3D173|nr:hypothetical protein [Colwellia sp. BRX10-3]MBA6391950.1 hypothetical protein [Colwellia sp. BRX10-3]
MFKYLPKRILVTAIISVLSGCATFQLTDLFQGYNSQMKPVKAAQRQGDFLKAQNLLGEREQSNNTYVLSLLERGRLQFLAANWPASQKTFAQAYVQVENQRNKAKIQISKGFENLGAVVSNDNATSYEVPYYEQGMLHSYQALNYLFQHDLSGALVEIRRANLVQENALKAYKDELYKAQNELHNSGMSTDSLQGGYPSMVSAIGKVKNGFQNAFTFYLSGILYEASGELNDAYIDYKRAIEIYPENNYLQQDVLRLATKLAMQDDLASFQQRFGKYQARDSKGQGQVVVLVERDIINSKQDVGLNLPVGRSNYGLKFFSFSLPVYEGALTQHSKISFKSTEQSYQSNEIVRIQSLAAKDLKDQLPSLLTRQVVRVVAKEQVRQKLSREAGDVGNILASIYNIASEKADTRSWSTLPDQVDIVRMDLPAGKQVLQVQVNGQQKHIEVDVQPNRITLINYSAIGSYTSYQVINL